MLAAMGELQPDQATRLRVYAPREVSAVFDVLAGVDVVVAARLHAVLLSHVARRPVFAVAHERKVQALMEQTEQARFCVDIDALRADDAWIRVLRAAAERDRLTRQIDRYVRSSAERVERQYDVLLGPRQLEQIDGHTDQKRSQTA
jgi:polysaccharide pyruvyl transferase WcaK-like protein